MRLLSIALALLTVLLPIPCKACPLCGSRSYRTLTDERHIIERVMVPVDCHYLERHFVERAPIHTICPDVGACKVYSLYPRQRRLHRVRHVEHGCYYRHAAQCCDAPSSSTVKISPPEKAVIPERIDAPDDR